MELPSELTLIHGMIRRHKAVLKRSNLAQITVTSTFHATVLPIVVTSSLGAYLLTFLASDELLGSADLSKADLSFSGTIEEKCDVFGNVAKLVSQVRRVFDPILQLRLSTWRDVMAA